MVSGQASFNFVEDGWVSPSFISSILNHNHYLGEINRGRAGFDSFGVLVLSSPTARHLPTSWLELSRWCLYGVNNGGSQQWKRVKESLRNELTDCTTVVSYSDPLAGHSGALYRASGWLWAPTWHRIQPPPSGNGSWTKGVRQSVKDRWVYPLTPDPEREEVLLIKDQSLLKKNPWARFIEPKWKRGRFIGGGADYKSFKAREEALSW